MNYLIFIKVIIPIVVVLITFASYDWKNNSHFKNIIVVILNLILWVLTADNLISENKREIEIETLEKTKSKNDSIYKVNESLNSAKQTKLLIRIDSITQLHKRDSVNLIICNIYRAKNMNNGINNGHIGDNKFDISNERQLTESDKILIIKRIDKVKKENKFSGNQISLRLKSDSNAGKFYAQMKDFLVTIGYQIISTSQLNSPGNLNGIMIEYVPNFKGFSNVIFITVGTL